MSRAFTLDELHSLLASRGFSYSIHQNELSPVDLGDGKRPYPRDMPWFFQKDGTIEVSVQTTHRLVK